MKLQIYHTVNAGLYLWNGKTGLLIDGLHTGKEAGFSDTPERYIRMMEERKGFFGQTNDLLFTHTHRDHYNKGLTEKFLEKNPDSFIYGPGLDRNRVQSVLLEKGVFEARLRDYIIYAFETRHDGKDYAWVPHYSYLIQAGEKRLWISGDAALTPFLAEQVKALCGGAGCYAAFVMVYQPGSRSGRKFLQSLLPENIYLYHLPYREEDGFHYYRMAETVTDKCRKEGIRIKRLRKDSFIEE
ncbi:MAG: hypothetical protein HFH12_13270 [Dorea sp.]|nr:hypothetical protein [Dorea sp.]